jgi:protein-glutamine gamma-glutamyltransferase
MKTPPWLMGGALLFWGWENGLLIWGALLAAALEGARLTRTRWEFSNADLNRISDLCGALFLGAALLLYSTQDRLVFVFKLAQWLPFCFFPLMLAQTYGNRATMPLSVFWWLLRRSPSSPTARKCYNISYCYFAICLLAASSSTQAAIPATPANRFFYAGMALLVALALTSARPQRVSLTAWVVLLAVSAVAGQFSHKQLQRMQNAMEGVLGAWIANFLHPSLDARECRTRIGFPGQIPLSGKIVLRVRPEPGGFVPALLREATWDAYKKETWSASNNDFFPARMGNDDNVKLLPTNTLSCEVEIARYYENGDGTLDLPHGTFEIDDVQQALVKTNRLGVAMFESGPGLLDLRASFGPGRSIDSPPCARDLAVDEKEKPALAQVAADLKLETMTDRQKIRAVERYFATHFTYSLNLPRRHSQTNPPSPLAVFLLRSHAGHCEYFATATVLLLRQAGVPARYVTGYVVPESARRGDTYLVRERHSHAWALAWHGDTGLWENIDTTPPGQEQAEGAEPSWWEPASDALSNLYFQFSKWRWSKTSYARFSSWLLVPMILYLIGRIIFTQRRQRPSSGADDAGRTPWPGLDSELYLINRQLAAAQLSRLPNEPLRSWQQRLELAFPDSDRLRRIFRLHRSLRFDPRGLEKNDRETLRNEAQRWLAEFTARAAAEKQNAPADRMQAPG